MKMHYALNKNLHLHAKRAGISHLQLKEICERQSKYFSYLTQEEGAKLLRWLKKHLEAGERWDHKEFKWAKVVKTVKAEVKTDDKEKLQFSTATNTLLHLKAKERGISHDKLLGMVKIHFDKDYIEMNDIEAWKLFYIITKDERKITEINEKLKRSKEDGKADRKR